jgi:hypothetical protein
MSLAKSPPSATKVGEDLADLNPPVGDEASSAGGPLMVEIRVSVPDAAGTHGLRSGSTDERRVTKALGSGR